VIPAYLNSAILARPMDDGPRGAAADWLEEYAADLPNPDAARARAEFIRVQVELARPIPPKPKRPPVPAALPVAERRGGLLNAYQKFGRYKVELEEHLAAVKARKPLEKRESDLAASRLLEDAFQPLMTGVMYWTTDSFPITTEQSHTIVRRGFADELRCHPSRFDVLAHLLFNHNPLTRVKLTGMDPLHDFGGYCWLAPRGGRTGPEVIPAELVPHMNAAVKADRDSSSQGDLSFFRTRAGAFNALSAACVRLGRERAKLPELAHYPPLLSPG
jgi:uncharacterized protein (TIGR02996 family)